MLDTVGLVTPQVQSYLRAGEAADEGVLRFLRQARPDYLVILPNWYPELASRDDLFEPVHEFVLDRVTIAAGPRLVVYRTVWADD